MDVVKQEDGDLGVEADIVVAGDDSSSIEVGERAGGDLDQQNLQDLETVSSAEDEENTDKQSAKAASDQEIEKEVILEREETPEEKLERIKQFYDIEFARPDLENLGQKTSWTLITYENYYQRSYGGDYGGVDPLSEENHAQTKKQDPKNAKIAEYFGEDLNSDEDVDQLTQQFSQSSMNTAGNNKADSKFMEGSEDNRDGNRPDKSLKIEPIPEENENELSDDGAGQKKSSRSKNKRKTAGISSTKVSIRHLPKSMRKEEFLEAIGQLPEHTFINFMPGYFLSKICSRRMTGYCNINFSKQEDADAFVTTYRMFILRDEKGNEHFASTDFAISQRIPKITNSTFKMGNDIYDMENDSRFQDFKNRYDSCTGIMGKSVNADGTVTAEVMIREIEERSQNKSEMQTTPLLSFLFQQAKLEKDKKYGGLLKKSSEKTRITIKKERKRERRDRKDKAKGKEFKDSEPKSKDRNDGGNPPKPDSPRKGAKMETPVKSDSYLKSNRKNEMPSQKNNNNHRPDPKSAKPSKFENETYGRQGQGGSGRPSNAEKPERMPRQGGTPKKFEKKQSDKNSPNSSSKGGKPGPSNGTSAEASINTEVRAAVKNEKYTKSEPVVTSENVENDNVPGKKKIIRKVVKVKRVVKNKSSDTVNELTDSSEKPLKAQQKEKQTGSVTGGSETASTAKIISDASASQRNESEPAGASVDSKRTKKARPDLQIYRPGSLRSNKSSEPSKGAGDNASANKRDRQSKPSENTNRNFKSTASTDETMERRNS